MEIQAPGTLDGGDILKVGDTVYIGRGGRTNAEGVAQLRRILAPLGGTVVAVPVTKVLHLKSAVTALPAVKQFDDGLSEMYHSLTLSVNILGSRNPGA